MIETAQIKTVEGRRAFFLPTYLLLVFGLSWPFQSAYSVKENR